MPLIKNSMDTIIAGIAVSITDINSSFCDHECIIFLVILLSTGWFAAILFRARLE
jgi:hypothetical protein